MCISFKCVCRILLTRGPVTRRCVEADGAFDYLYGRRKAETLLWMRRMKERGSISVESRVEYL